MDITVSHPKYTNKQQDKIKNIGDIIISEGSFVRWEVELKNSENCLFLINNKVKGTSKKNNINITDQILNSVPYSIIISNSNNLSDTISCFVNVISDEFPEINVTQTYDTLNNTCFFNGTVQDDYLIEKLEFICKYIDSDTAFLLQEKINIERKNLELLFIKKRLIKN